MPKKRHPTQYTKPPTTVHHSLSSASTASPSATRRDGLPTVNELLSTLRTSHISADADRKIPVIAPSMPAPIRQLLDLPDTPAPAPRRRQRVDNLGRRLPAGPAPPRSWLETSRYAPSRKFKARETAGRRRDGADRLPGGSLHSTKGSLMATCLKRLAQEWELQKEYNRYYLASLPTPVRMVLLSYIVTYGPEDGVGLEGLKMILRPQDDLVEGFSGNDDFVRLDLEGAVGRSISFRQLQEVVAPSTSHTQEDESWDATSGSIPRALQAPLQSLKYLSLANPPRTISWAKFLTFARAVPTVTHLSLANWPTPSLTPNSTTTTISSPYAPKLQYGASNYYSHSLDGDWSEAADILRRLSSSLYSLAYLDLDGCNSWISALLWTKSPGINWVSRWGSVRIITLRSEMEVRDDSRDADIMSYKARILDALALERFIARQRGWIEVLHDEWEKYDDIWEVGAGMKMLSRGPYDMAKSGLDVREQRQMLGIEREREVGVSSMIDDQVDAGPSTRFWDA